MSLDGGYIGSEEHALANLHIGRQQGFDEGRNYGFEGGKIYGWNEAWNQANQRIDSIALEQEEAEENHQLLVLRFNRMCAFSDSVRSVLEELLASGNVDANTVKRHFHKFYSEELKCSLDEGYLINPLEEDADFAEMSPKAYNFLIDMMK